MKHNISILIDVRSEAFICFLIVEINKLYYFIWLISHGDVKYLNID